MRTLRYPKLSPLICPKKRNDPTTSHSFLYICHTEIRFDHASQNFRSATRSVSFRTFRRRTAPPLRPYSSVRAALQIGFPQSVSPLERGSRLHPEKRPGDDPPSRRRLHSQASCPCLDSQRRSPNAHARTSRIQSTTRHGMLLQRMFREVASHPRRTGTLSRRTTIRRQCTDGVDSTRTPRVSIFPIKHRKPLSRICLPRHPSTRKKRTLKDSKKFHFSLKIYHLDSNDWHSTA